MTTGIRFSLLGPMRASYSDQPLDLGPARERALLAVLLCRVNEVVGSAELLDAVWDDQPPSSGLKVIPTYIYRLRKSVAPTSGAVRIDSTPDGYVLRTDPENLDTTMFDRAVTLASARRCAGDAEGARAWMDEALGLWRGAPFTGLPGSALAAQRRKLSEQRLRLLEERIELDLRCGRHAELVGELQALRAAHPWRERFAALLMVALYRCGRQAEALAVYAEAREQLRDALGVDPGAELTSTHQAVLRCDEQLGEPSPVLSRPHWQPRRDLPAEPGCLLGRDPELATLTEAGSGVLTIDGMPGVGKTALGLSAAHRLAERHPDGALYLDLAGGGVPAGAALRRLLIAVGTSAEAVPEDTAERAALWRSLLAGRKVLLYLDNAAHSDQVLPLLPGESGCTVLVSGRRRLGALPVHASVSLDVLDGEAARRLLGQQVGERRLVDEPAAVHTVLATCAGLPAAIVLAGLALRHRAELSVAEFAGRLADPLAALRVESRGLAEVFEPSVAALSAPARCSLVAGPTASSAGLEELLDASLVRRVAGEFAVHPLLTAYARRSDPVQSRDDRDLSQTDPAVVARHPGMGQHVEPVVPQRIHRAV